MTAHTKKKALPARRPAETGGVAGAVAVLVCKLLGVDDPTTLTALGVVVGFVPAGITWLVATVKG